MCFFVKLPNTEYSWIKNIRWVLLKWGDKKRALHEIFLPLTLYVTPFKLKVGSTVHFIDNKSLKNNRGPEDPI